MMFFLGVIPTYSSTNPFPGLISPTSGIRAFYCNGDERALLQCRKYVNHCYSYSSSAGVRCHARSGNYHFEVFNMVVNQNSAMTV